MTSKAALNVTGVFCITKDHLRPVAEGNKNIKMDVDRDTKYFSQFFYNCYEVCTFLGIIQVIVVEGN